jgi:hypothetical protein
MKKCLILLAVVLWFFISACAGPQPHRFLHGYSTAQALQFVRQVLNDHSYQIAIFDISTGVLKTDPRDFIGEDGGKVQYQISVTVVKLDELLVKVIPASAVDYRDQIMEPIVASLQAMGFDPKYIPPPPRHPRHWSRPPSPPPSP